MEKFTRKLPIGVQSFEKLRSEGFIYIDKTKYIYELAHTSSQYFLSRPRRFGKSLFLSTLRAYWEGKKELFEGLDIVELEKNNPDAWQPYPVFYFDFNRDSFQRTHALEVVIEAHLEDWEKIYGCEKEDASLAIRFQKLLVRAVEKTGRKAVVLVDEYDKPLLETLETEELQIQNKEVFKGFFSALKSYDAYLRFVFITGVTKFSKVSIFSDLNQLNDISFNQEFSSLCGITEEELMGSLKAEICELAKEHDLSFEECLERLRKMYDGYHFHHKGEGVYNPFSLLKAMFDKSFGAYWFATGTPTFLVRRLREIEFDVNQFTDCSLYASESELSDYRADNPDPVPLLYQTGYLTIVGYNTRLELCMLGFPNKEVQYGLLESMMPAYAPVSAKRKGKDIISLDRCIEQGDTDGIQDILTALFASIPYTSLTDPFEHYFETVIYLVFTLLGKYTKCEVHSAKGRADCIVETKDFVYIFEFKLDKSADEALSQIEEKGYAKPYAADLRKFYKVGVNFDSKERNITEWKVKV